MKRSKPASVQNSHDQNFKNLIVDFALGAIRFFAGLEGADLPDDTVITPLRQEQLKERLTEGHHEVDTAFLAETPSGQRKAIVYLIEEETDPRHFSIHRLGKYMLEVSELHRVNRIVPVVIFVKPGNPEQKLELGTELGRYLFCTYISCHLAQLDALDYVNSTNVVARIVLPCMRIPDGRRVEIVARALEGLVTLETNVHKQRKYVDFITMYAGLEDEERVELAREVERTPWGKKMTGWLGEAEAKGKAEGKAEVLLRLATRLGLRPTPAQRKQVLGCTDEKKLDLWCDRVVTARTMDAVLAPKRATSRRPKPH